MSEQWTVEAAQAWFDQQPWFVGCNFTPSTAINQIEMWQADSFDMPTIRSELDLAASVHMNAVRVYLHDLLWMQDTDGFIGRIEEFLAAAHERGIRVLMVLFDSCWDPEPHLGPQRQPLNGVHNSGWVQSPGLPALKDPAQRPRLEAYVKGIVSHFGQDERIIGWDIWNEPDNGPEVALADPAMLAEKAALVLPVMTAAFGWVRSCAPIQPLTSGIWLGDWSSPDKLTPIQRAQTGLSDIISFHNYGTPEDFNARVGWLRAFGRPIWCTEFMARPAGSTFQAILPHARRQKVGAFSWGLVRGKTQTHLPWDNWTSPFPEMSAETWFHDIFDERGEPHDPAEVEFLRLLRDIDIVTTPEQTAG